MPYTRQKFVCFEFLVPLLYSRLLTYRRLNLFSKLCAWCVLMYLGVLPWLLITLIVDTHIYSRKQNLSCQGVSLQKCLSLLNLKWRVCITIYSVSNSLDWYLLNIKYFKTFKESMQLLYWFCCLSSQNIQKKILHQWSIWSSWHTIFNKIPEYSFASW